jgi:hypothetical protein
MQREREVHDVRPVGQAVLRRRDDQVERVEVRARPTELDQPRRGARVLPDLPCDRNAPPTASDDEIRPRRRERARRRAVQWEPLGGGGARMRGPRDFGVGR